jgi:Protein of unknown function DUF262/Protein of unknown function (DUF1524)
MGAINFDTSNKTFREVLGNGARYEVPKFQRDYAWTEEQWFDLWSDLDDVMRDGADELYMGHLILQRDDDDVYIVIDGQQRLTTITLIVIAALYRLKELIAAGETPDDNTRRLEELQRTYVGSRDPVTLVVANKLKLNRNNQEYFKTYLASLENRPRVSGRKKSESLLVGACKFFQAKFKESNKNGVELATFVQTMARKVLFTTIHVASEVNAYRVFETLNARGVQLSAPDLLKNFLFSVVDKGNDGATHEQRILELEEQWSSTLDQLGKNDFSQFLMTEWNRRNTMSRQTELFKRVKASITTATAAFEQLKTMRTSSEVYAAFKDPDEDFWRQHNAAEAFAAIQSLRLFSVHQPLGLLVTAWEKLPRKEFMSVLRMVEVISLRYNVICQKPAKDQEDIYNKTSRKLYEGRPASDVAESLRAIYPSDFEFKAAFAKRTFIQARHKIVRHLLTKIEHHLNPSLALDDDALTVEHVMPASPPSDSSWQWVEELPERLGNMTLLTAKANRRAAQGSFAEKRLLFDDSPYEITKKILEANAWNSAEIDARQAWLADQACAVWRIPQLS